MSMASTALLPQWVAPNSQMRHLLCGQASIRLGGCSGDGGGGVWKTQGRFTALHYSLRRSKKERVFFVYLAVVERKRRSVSLRLCHLHHLSCRECRIASRHLNVTCSATGATSAGDQPAEDESLYQVLGVSPFEKFDAIKVAYTRRYKDAEKRGDEAAMARFERAYDKLLMAQLTNRKKGRTFGDFEIAEVVKKSQEGSGRMSNKTQRLTITRPDDWHLHLRDGDVLSSVVPHSASTFKRAIIMPNLKPPVTTVAAAIAYQERILSVLPIDTEFQPLMTLYLTDSTTTNEIRLAKESGVVFGVKLYPAGATTNSQAGVTDLFNKCMPMLEEMAAQGLPLLVHGEVADPSVDIFDRERIFIETVLLPLVKRLPQLRIVMEHITTQDAVEFVEACPNGSIAATVTPQHLLLNRNAIFQGGLRPHNYCLPVLKREKHRQALVSAVTSGSSKYFLGTDSAPHERHTKEASCGCAGIYSAPISLALYARAFEQAGALDKLEAFASFNGPDFYKLPRNTATITLEKVSMNVPTEYSFGSGTVVPMCAGETLEWSIASSKV